MTHRLHQLATFDPDSPANRASAAAELCMGYDLAADAIATHFRGGLESPVDWVARLARIDQQTLLAVYWLTAPDFPMDRWTVHDLMEVIPRHIRQNAPTVQLSLRRLKRAGLIDDYRIVFEQLDGWVSEP